MRKFRNRKSTTRTQLRRRAAKALAVSAFGAAALTGCGAPAPVTETGVADCQPGYSEHDEPCYQEATGGKRAYYVHEKLNADPARAMTFEGETLVVGWTTYTVPATR